MLHEAVYYIPLGTSSAPSSVQCLLCPHKCVIADGGAGRCRVRINYGGTLYAGTYGLVSSLALDPIEKKPFAHYYPGSFILSAGNYGCNLSCLFCQNHAISQTGGPFLDGCLLADEGGRLPDDGVIDEEGSAASERLVQTALRERENGNIGIAFTYNEPLVGYEFVRDTVMLSRKADLKNVLVTNGYINSEPLEALLPYIDAMNIDLKAFTENFYHKICAGHLEPVLETISRSAPRCHVEITTLVIPGRNSSPSEIDSLSAWIASISPDIPLHLNRHHPAYKMKEPAPIMNGELFALAEIARTHLHNVHCGNVQ